jgi:hypothetical protein
LFSDSDAWIRFLASQGETGIPALLQLLDEGVMVDSLLPVLKSLGVLAKGAIPRLLTLAQDERWTEEARSVLWAIDPSIAERIPYRPRWLDSQEK